PKNSVSIIPLCLLLMTKNGERIAPKQDEATTETVSRIEGSIWAPSIHPKQPKTSPFALPFTPLKR
ncbi:MAG: hypothetical protein KJ694_20425, partial [Gammaproteobacteria bacterium]|nr:hypothetical protein [Gammaproteobacteria bacterium]